jgi:hypothetical protein
MVDQSAVNNHFSFTSSNNLLWIGITFSHTCPFQALIIIITAWIRYYSPHLVHCMYYTLRHIYMSCIQDYSYMHSHWWHSRYIYCFHLNQDTWAMVLRKLQLVDDHLPERHSYHHCRPNKLGTCRWRQGMCQHLLWN